MNTELIIKGLEYLAKNPDDIINKCHDVSF